MLQWRLVSGSRMDKAIMKKMKKAKEAVKMIQEWKMKNLLPKKCLKDHRKTALVRFQG
jgi:ribosomal protein S21